MATFFGAAFRAFGKGSKSFSEIQAWEARRTKTVMQVDQYMWLIMPATIALLYGVVAAFRYEYQIGTSIIVDKNLMWSKEATLWLVLALPARVTLYLFVFFACWPSRPFWLWSQPEKRSFTRLLICVVTRGDNEEVVNQTVQIALAEGLHHHRNVSIHVLSEEVNAHRFHGRFPSCVSVHGVPKAFETKKAKFKARSLEWFRRQMNVGKDDWILHLDEETAIDNYALETCIAFITRQTRCDVGTGVIHYNLPGYWSNVLTTIADVNRVISDWTRLQWFANHPEQVALGIHGAFILIRGEVENAVTWETDHVTEDYWFLLGAIDKGYRVGWLPAIAREVSPTSLYDFVRQRQRWYTGIRTVGQFWGYMNLLTVGWTLVGLIFQIWTLFTWTTRQTIIPSWYLHVLNFDLASQLAVSYLSLLVQDFDAGCSLEDMAVHAIFAYFAFAISGILECYSMWMSLIMPDKGFFVIKKEAGIHAKNVSSKLV